MRDTFASNALHAGVTVFELARVMGTSVRMIEKHYGTLVDGAMSCTRLRAVSALGSRASASVGCLGSGMPRQINSYGMLSPPLTSRLDALAVGES
jgi:hypothetical protein